MVYPLKNAKLTEVEVVGIRKRIYDELSTVKLEAERYGVTRETIRRVMRGETFVNAGEVRMVAPTYQTPVRSKEEAEASLQRTLEMQKGRVIPARDLEILQRRGLANLIVPPPEEDEEPGNPLEEGPEEPS